ncbi:hypothetical protein DFJ73DRAFT_840693 [Zopfochytrium polystomum]|nr:hypothetical protein DFJ73DRAFT_840693 [Zopfochytrium polystomum]
MPVLLATVVMFLAQPGRLSFEFAGCSAHRKEVYLAVKYNLELRLDPSKYDNSNTACSKEFETQPDQGAPNVLRPLSLWLTHPLAGWTEKDQFWLSDAMPQREVTACGCFS